MALIDTIRGVVKETLEAIKPARVLLASVESAMPLKLFVDNRYYLEENVLIIPDVLKPGTITEDHLHEIPEHVSERSLLASDYEHRHDIQPYQTVSITYTGLQPGDKVILLQNHGGNSFVVLGRVV